jgi:uncharacterized membrane protein YjgN (DUF898 family)
MTEIQPVKFLAPALSAEHLNFEFVKRPGLFKITVVNALLWLITLGIYRFWGKTNVRKHIWSSVHINGEPLEYTGTGGELFKGFVVVFLTTLLPIALGSVGLSLILGPESPWLAVYQVLVFLVFYIFLGFALYKARKYQLTRTNWRGIRGNLIGSAMTYSWTLFGAMIAKVLSLGWATPVMNTILQEQIISDMRFGDAAFKFRGRAGKLYPTYALCWLLCMGLLTAGATALVYFAWELVGGVLQILFEPSTSNSTIEFSNILPIVTGLGLTFLAYMLVIPALWAIYTARELGTFAQFTRIDGSPFKLDVTAASVIWLTLINLLIIVFTLGFGQPFAQRRLVRFIIDRLSLQGTIDIDRIRQSRETLSTRGEGLADAFDVGGL